MHMHARVNINNANVSILYSIIIPDRRIIRYYDDDDDDTAEAT